MSRPTPRLYVSEDLASDAELVLAGNPANYLSQVMRLKAGRTVRLFNGRDGEWQAEITHADRRRVTLLVSEHTRKQIASQPIVLAFAPLKKTPMDFLIGKATELGVSALQPVITERTETRRLSPDRLQAQIREAAEQCERLDLPILRESLAFTDFLSSWRKSDPLWCCDETGEGRSFPDLLIPRGDEPPNQAHGFLIGPEGGFTPNELATLDGLDFVTRVDLGPRILRAETAALAALTCWQALLGDWRRLN